jgi:hypothetical protein
MSSKHNAVSRLLGVFTLVTLSLATAAGHSLTALVRAAAA